VLAASSLGVLALVASTGTVHADPAWEAGAFGLASTRVGVGSDTIQNVFDGFSGADTYPIAPSATAAGPSFTTPLHSNPDSGSVVLQSFDAFPPPNGTSSSPGCIVSKVNGATFDRPNGSGAGINALNDANSGTLWENSASTTCTHTLVSLTGLVDFARSSRGPINPGTTDTWIPFARDGIAYAFYDQNTGSLGSLTSTQIQDLYTSPTGTITVAGHTVIACIMQPNSGTRIASEKQYGFSDAQAIAATTATGCGTANASIVGSGTSEENNGTAFYNLVQALIAGGTWGSNTWAVIPFSAGVWMSQADGHAPDFSSALRNAESSTPLDGLGEPDSFVPLTGTGPSPASANNGSYTFSPAFYHVDDVVATGLPYGRYLYVVVPTSKIGAVGADKALKELFVGATSAICTQGQTIINQYGFDSTQPTDGELACGDVSTTGAS